MLFHYEHPTVQLTERANKQRSRVSAPRDLAIFCSHPNSSTKLSYKVQNLSEHIFLLKSKNLLGTTE